MTPSASKNNKWILSTLGNLISRFIKFVDSSPYIILGLIIIFGLILSVINIVGDPPTMKSGSTDSWWTIALNLIHGQGYSLCIPRYFPFCSATNQTTAAREPIPVLLFSGVALVSGESLWAATFVELFIYLGVLVAVFFLTREWTSTRAGLLAAFLWSFYLPAQDLLSQVSGDLFAALNVTIGLLFFMRARRTKRVRDWMISGIAIGLAVMSRSAVLAVAVILIVGQIVDDGWINREKHKQAVKPFLILSGLLFLFMTPWLVRNQISLGRPIIGSSLVGYNMFRQAHLFEENEGLFRYVGGVEGIEVVDELVVRLKNALIGTENEAQMDVIYRNEAFRVIRENPVKYILLSGYHFFPLWFNWGIPEGDGYKTSRLGYVLMLLQAIFLVLAMVAIRGNLYSTWPLWSGILIISLAYMLVESQLRYLIPVIPLVMSLSAAGWQKIVKTPSDCQAQ